MNFIFDTDSVCFLFGKNSNEHTKIRHRILSLNENDVIYVSFITLFELEYSLSNATDALRKQEIRTTIDNTKQRFQIIPLKLEFASKYGEIKSKLKNHWGNSSKGMKKHNLDLMIASTAISESFVLVAHDVIYKDLFKVYPQIKYECWTA